MSNTKSEMKNTLEGINSRINESEEQISELEDKVVEITSTEQNKVKRMKDMRTVSETSGKNLMCQHSHYRGPKRRRERERA